VAGEPSVDAFRTLFEELLAEAQDRYDSGSADQERKALGDDLAKKVDELAQTKHAARGVALTLCAYKAFQPSQDIRYDRTEYEGGFSARSYDAAVTVPILMRESLPHSSSSHWLTRRFAEAPFLIDSEIRTVPKKAGPMLLEVLDEVQRRADREVARAAAVLLLVNLFEVRARNKVRLTRPKNLTIEEVERLLETHFGHGYESNSPRLPQLAVYAMYQCLVRSIDRYRDRQLDPLMRMKAADRKAGTVGDVVLSDDSVPYEGAEVKFGMPIDVGHVQEAIEKLRAASVERYFLLATQGVRGEDQESIDELCRAFRKSNGCELIPDSVVTTIGNRLRDLKSVDEFIYAYADLVEEDPDLEYEHRIAWNELCAKAGVAAV